MGQLLQATNPNLIELQRLSSESVGQAAGLIPHRDSKGELSTAGWQGPQLVRSAVPYLNEPL